MQVAGLAYLAATGPWKAQRIDFQIWELSGLFLALAGLVGLSWHSFSIFPEPKAHGRFVQSGVYAIIRHPMYAGILVICVTLVWEFWSWPRGAVALLLLVVFVLKILLEEKYMEVRFPGYTIYQKRTNRLIPFLW